MTMLMLFHGPASLVIGVLPEPFISPCVSALTDFRLPSAMTPRRSLTLLQPP